MWRKLKMHWRNLLPAIDIWLFIAATIVFGAALVRGFSGFGFSLLAISGLSLIYPLQDVIAPIFMMEVAASLNLLPAIWRDIHWRSLMPLTLGCLIATPIGVYLLANVPAQPMQLALSVFVLVATVLLWKGFALKSMPGTAATTAAGAAAGLANGAFGIGGPPIVLFYFSSPAGNVAGRASLIVFFLITDVIGLANQSVHGLIGQDTILRAAWFLPPLIIGVRLGALSFKDTNPETFRKTVLLLLAALSIGIAIKAVIV
jgi:uncharacterized protein